LRDEVSLTTLYRCACCDGQLEPAQQLRFLVETATLDNPVHLARIRVLPCVKGKPIPVCKACQTRIEAAPARRPARPLAAGMLGVFGALSVGLLLGGLFTSRG
jgi:hypothetical protein